MRNCHSLCFCLDICSTTSLHLCVGIGLVTPVVLGGRRYNYSFPNPIVIAISPLLSHWLPPRHCWEMFPLISPVLSGWFMTQQDGCVGLSHKQPFPKYWEGANLFPPQVPWAVIPVYISNSPSKSLSVHLLCCQIGS